MGSNRGDVASCCRSRRARKLVIAVHEYEYSTRTQGPFGVIVCRTPMSYTWRDRPRAPTAPPPAAAGRHLAAGRRTGGGGDGGGDGGGEGGEGGGKGGGWPSTALTTAVRRQPLSMQCINASMPSLCRARHRRRRGEPGRRRRFYRYRAMREPQQGARLVREEDVTFASGSRGMRMVHGEGPGRSRSGPTSIHSRGQAE